MISFINLESYKVISRGKIASVGKPDFGWKYGHAPEKDFVDFFIRMKPYIDSFKNDGIIYDSQEKEIDQEEKKRREEFYNGFIGNNNEVQVEKNGIKYKVVTCGYHRTWIAKHYGFDLIVRVID